MIKKKSCLFFSCFFSWLKTLLSLLAAKKLSFKPRGTKCYLNSLMPFLRSGLVQSGWGEKKGRAYPLSRERGRERATCVCCTQTFNGAVFPLTASIHQISPQLHFHLTDSHKRTADYYNSPVTSQQSVSGMQSVKKKRLFHHMILF